MRIDKQAAKSFVLALGLWAEVLQYIAGMVLSYAV